MYWKTIRESQEGERLRSWPHQYRQIKNRSMATILWQREPDQNGGIWMARNCQHGQLSSGGRALLAQPNTWPGESRHSDCILPWWIQEVNFLKRKLGYCHKLEMDTGEPKTWIEFHYEPLKMNTPHTAGTYSYSCTRLCCGHRRCSIQSCWVWKWVNSPKVHIVQLASSRMSHLPPYKPRVATTHPKPQTLVRTRLASQESI